MFDSVTYVAANSALDGLALRQRVIANNISNINTPGYLAQRVSFEAELAGAISDGSGATTASVARSLEPTRENGNNVNLDAETLLNIDSNLRYQLATQIVDGQFSSPAHGDEDRLMGLFGAIGVASTGMTVGRKWMDAVSDNIANANTVRSTAEAAFQQRYIVATAVEDGGVQVGGTLLGDPEGRLTYEPDHPLADAEGMVRYPDIDMTSQMTQLIMAQRGYQANAAVVDRARETYQAALQIGRN